MRREWRSGRLTLLGMLALVLGLTALGPAAPAASLAAPAPAVGLAAQGRTHVEVGVVVSTVSYLDMYVAAARGLFAEQGLEVETTSFPDPGTAGRAFVSGSTDLASTGLDYTIRAAEQTNNNVALIAGQDRRSVFSLVATPDISGYADLRGQTLAVVGPNDGTTLLLKRMLAANGLRESDYELRVVGGTPNRVAAMQAGAAKAGMIAPPASFTLLDGGMRLLGLANDYVPDYAFSNWSVRRDWAERNSETVVRFLTAIVKADRWIAQPANKDEGIAILAEATRQPPPMARRTWEFFIEQIDGYTRDGAVHLPGMQAIIEQLGEIGDLPRPLPSPERYLAPAYLEQALQRAQ